MPPLMSHRQIQSRSGDFTGQVGLVAPPGINGTVPAPGEGIPGWAALPGGSSQVRQGGRRGGL